MDQEEKSKIDWVHLPLGVDDVSLWHCLHDGELISCKSNHPERIVTLEFSVKHLLYRDENETTFLLEIGDVTSVRAIGHFGRIEEFREPEGISNEERTQLIKEYWAKWREESLTWLEFESALATDPLQIMEAGFASNADETTLRLGGFLNGEKFDDIYFDVFVRGKGMAVSRSDGNDFSFDAFIELGKNYWNDVRS